MFNWLRPRCSVQPDVRAWVAWRMAWLVSQFGRDRLTGGRVVLPSEEYFPSPYDGSREDARVLLDQVCRYVDIDPRRVNLSFYSEQQRVALNTEVVRPDGGGTVGLYDEENGRMAIWLEESRLADPVSVVATCVHELCHAHLLGGSRVSRDEKDNEPLTDLATVYFGMGIFTANASLRDRNYHVANWEGWSISRQGYLSGPVLAYALALYAWLRQETRPDWGRYLRPDVRSEFRAALLHLTRTNQPVLPSQEMQDAESPELTPDLWQKLGIRTPSSSEVDKDFTEDDADTPADSDAAHFAHAAVLMRNGRWHEAAQALSDALARDPRDGEAYQQRALAYLKLERRTEALADAEEAVRWLPDDSDSYRVRGMVCLELDRYDRAVADFTRYLREEDRGRIVPAQVGEVYYLRGLAHAKRGQPSKAISDFTDATRQWPAWAAPYEARAAAYEQLGKSKKALADREEAGRLTKS
jgi:tetratricopeptide (TPR) repeat protein